MSAATEDTESTELNHEAHEGHEEPFDVGLRRPSNGFAATRTNGRGWAVVSRPSCSSCASWLIPSVTSVFSVATHSALSVATL